MAEERTLGIARARDTGDEEPSKEELQRRMEEARDSITSTVTEIKENVAQQVETVKDALDWREHFKKRPVAWSVGAAGVGFFVGYGIAAALTDDEEDNYVAQTSTYARSLTGEPINKPAITSNGKDEGPGLLERFKDTSAYDRLSKEAGAIGDRLVNELSTTAQVVVLPLLLNKIKGWIGIDLSDKTASMGTTRESGRETLQSSASQAN
ncbi:MAG TPA: hypothetical protein VEW46_09060 [Pyrinomonadaceae bacterium]|nr:hypothetical protein [Pyrinomonadaceae bacterium]